MEREKNPTILVPVRITHKQDDFLRGFVQEGMFSSRQEAIKYFISEKMLKVDSGPRKFE